MKTREVRPRRLLADELVERSAAGAPGRRPRAAVSGRRAGSEARHRLIPSAPARAAPPRISAGASSAATTSATAAAASPGAVAEIDQRRQRIGPRLRLAAGFRAPPRASPPARSARRRRRLRHRLHRRRRACGPHRDHRRRLGLQLQHHPLRDLRPDARRRPDRRWRRRATAPAPPPRSPSVPRIASAALAPTPCTVISSRCHSRSASVRKPMSCSRSSRTRSSV